MGKREYGYKLCLIHTYIHTCIHTYIYVPRYNKYVRIYKCTYNYIFIHLFVCIFTSKIHTYIHNTYIHTYIHTYRRQSLWSSPTIWCFPETASLLSLPLKIEVFVCVYHIFFRLKRVYTFRLFCSLKRVTLACMYVCMYVGKQVISLLVRPNSSAKSLVNVESEEQFYT